MKLTKADRRVLEVLELQPVRVWSREALVLAKAEARRGDQRASYSGVGGYRPGRCIDGNSSNR